MAGRLFLVVLRTVLGVALIAIGVAMVIAAGTPDFMPLLQHGNLILGPGLVVGGLIVAGWPAAKRLLGLGRSRPRP